MLAKKELQRDHGVNLNRSSAHPILNATMIAVLPVEPSAGDCVRHQAVRPWRSEPG